MKRKTTLRLIISMLLIALLPACSSPAKTIEASSPVPATPSVSPREMMKTIQNYMVYYGTGRVDDLAHYDLAIVQPDTLTSEELVSLKERGTLVVAYLSVGEVEPNRAWYTDGRANPRWILGKNQDWGSYFIDARQTGWQELMINLTGEFIDKGFQGVFMDTVDTASAYPETQEGMIALIHGLREAYPNALLIQNRGMSIADEVASDLDGLMFEDVSTTYDFEKQEYQTRENSDEISAMADFKARTNLPILGLDYAPVDNPGMAYQAVKQSQENGFIPCVSTINLDDIPDYGLNKPGHADIKISSIKAEGDENNVTVVVRIQNVGLAIAVDVPVSILIDNKPAGSIHLTMEPGNSYDWSISWPTPVENKIIEVNSVMDADPTENNNNLTWTFTYASIAMEPLLPYDQQKHRNPDNGPEMVATYFSTQPDIDADLSEWAGLPCTVVNTTQQVSFGDKSQWSSAEDLSGRICYGWDDQNIYLAFSIQDDIHVQKYTGGNLWMGDHVELWFDTQLQLDFDSESDSDDDFQLGLSSGDYQEIPADFFIFTPATPAELYSDIVEWKVIQTDQGYSGEAKIPVKVLKGLRLAEGQTIGATFEPSDTDTPGGSDQELMMSTAPESSTNWGNPTYWNNLTFTKDE